MKDHERLQSKDEQEVIHGAWIPCEICFMTFRHAWLDASALCRAQQECSNGSAFTAQRC